MNAPALQELRRKLAADEPTYGLWVTLESASVTEMAVALGLDWVVIDAEHGHLDWREVLDHLRAAVRSRTVALVRLTELNAGLIKRALDIGADGVVIPWIETADELARAVAYAHYPPSGRRGIGGERATCWGRCLPQHVAEAEAHVLVVPIIESVRAAENIEEICRVPGVELVQLGPADFSSTAGYPGQWEGPGVAQQLLAIKDTVRSHGKHCGVVATGPDDLAARCAQGFRFLGVGLDAALLVRSLGTLMERAGRGQAIQPGFLSPMPTALTGPAGPAGPAGQTRLAVPAAVPGPAVQARPAGPAAATAPPGQAGAPGQAAVAGPVRPTVPAGSAERAGPAVPAAPAPLAEDDNSRRTPLGVASPHTAPVAASGSGCTQVVVSALAQAVRRELEPGVVFRPLVGGFNSRASVTVGWVHFAPQRGLACHQHPFAELVLVTAGELVVQVEERAYRLQSGDAMCIPPHTPHQARNSSANRPATICIAMGAAEPTHTLVHDRYTRRWMPDSALAEPGKEQIIREALPPARPRAVRAAAAQQLGPLDARGVRQARWFLGPAAGMGMGAVMLAGGGQTALHAQHDLVLLAIRGRCRCGVGDRHHVLGEGTALVVPAGHDYWLAAGEALVIWVAAPPPS